MSLFGLANWTAGSPDALATIGLAETVGLWRGRPLTPGSQRHPEGWGSLPPTCRILHCLLEGNDGDGWHAQSRAYNSRHDRQ